MVGPTTRGTHKLSVSIRFILVGVLIGLLAVQPTQRPLLTRFSLTYRHSNLMLTYQFSPLSALKRTVSHF
jgi:hypothetical protein